MTNAVAASLERLAQDLAAVHARWALIGGFAVSARADARFTRDVDVCVLVADDEEAERLALAMTRLGYAVSALIEHELARRLSTLRLVSPVDGGVLVDLLCASSGIEAETVEAAEPLELMAGLVVPVARAAHLVVLKLLSRDDEKRPQDAMDLRALRPTLSAGDEAEVCRLAGLVGQRGFDRGRDLPALARTYLSRP